MRIQKKRSWVLLVIMTMVMVSALVLSACGGGAAKAPVEKAGGTKAFTLDINGSPSQTLNVSDYVDAEGCEGVTYSTRSQRARNVTVTQPNASGAFVIEAQEEYSSPVSVYLEARQNNEVVLEIVFSVTVQDTTPRFTIGGFTDHINGVGYTLEAEPTVVQGQPYSFVITRAYGFKGTPEFSYTLGGTAGAALTPVEEPKGVFTYTIAGDVMADMLFVEGEDGIIRGFTFDSFEDAYPILPMSFFTATSWTGGSGAAPTQEGEAVKFDGSFRRFAVTDLPQAVYLNVNQDDVQVWADPEKKDFGPYSFTFMLKAEGPFTFAFLSSGASTPNELQLIYDGTKFSIGRSVGGGKATFGTALDTETGFAVGEEFRIDLIVSAVYKKVASDGLADIEESDPQSGLIKFAFYLNGEKMVFKNGGNSVVSNTGSSGHHFRLDEGDTYIQRLNLPNNPARYNNYLTLSTIGENDGAVTIGKAPILGERVEVEGATRDEAGFTMYGLAAARGGQDYKLTLERDAAFDGTPSIATTIGGVAYTLAAPAVEDNVFVFTIPGDAITGNIVFGAVSGIQQLYFDVNLPAVVPGYTISEALDVAERGKNYVFKLTISTGYTAQTGFKVQYAVADGAAKDATLTGTAPYVVTIPQADIQGTLTITVVGVVQNTATYTVLGIQNGDGYTMAGDATVDVPNEGEYEILVTVLAGYAVYGELQLPVTIDGKVTTLRGVETEEDSGIYAFEIAKAFIVTNVTVGVPVGIKQGFGVNGIGAQADYTVEGEDLAYFGVDYEFSIVVTDPDVLWVPSYQVGTAAAKAAVYVSSSADALRYTYKIPAADYVAGQPVTISVASADAAGISVKTYAPTIGSLNKQGEYNFSDIVDVGALSVTYIAEYVSGGELTLNSTADKFTIEATALGIGQSIVVRVWVLKGGKIAFRTDVAVVVAFEALEDFATGADNTGKNSVNLFTPTNKVFDVASWEGVTGGRNNKPVQQADGSLKFDNTTQRVTGATINASEADLTAETVGSYTYSMMFLTSDTEFSLRFFATGGESEQLTVKDNGTANPSVDGNSYSLTYKDGRFTYYATLGLGDAYTAPYYFTPAEFELGKWNRIDFEFTTVMDDLTGGGNGNYKAEWGTIETRIYINGVLQEMEDAAGAKTAEKVVASNNRVSKLTEGVPSFMRYGSGGAKNYATYFILQTMQDGSISIAPASGWKA